MDIRTQITHFFWYSSCLTATIAHKGNYNRCSKGWKFYFKYVNIYWNVFYKFIFG